MISEYFKMAYRNIKHRKLRSSLTMIGIVISIATVFVLISLSIGLNNTIKEQFELFGTDKIFIMPKGQAGAPGAGGAVELTTYDAEVIEKVSGVKEVSYVTAGTVEVKINDKTRYVYAIGVPLDKSDLWLEGGLIKVEDGNLPQETETGKAVLGYLYKSDSLFGKAVAPGDKVIINGQKFTVKGILKSQGNPSDDQQILLSLTDFKLLFPKTGDRVDQIVAKVDEGANIDEVARSMEKKLRSFRDVTEKTQDFTISTPEELLATFGIVLNILTGFLVGIGGISLLVGGIGIANTMYTSVVERTREIGVMKAVGAKNSNILYTFMVEAGLLGAIGGTVGVLVGIGAAKLVEFIVGTQLGYGILKVATPAYLIIGCIVFAFIIGAVSGTVPAWQASKIKPVDALRYE
jgi:putative ABC transport system permease protein